MDGKQDMYTEFDEKSSHFGDRRTESDQWPEVVLGQ